MKKGLLIILCAALALCSTAVAEVEKEPEFTHYLLLGFDFWGNEEIGVSYSDTNILATIDKANGRLMVTSLLRDTYVQKLDGKWGRLNHIVRDFGMEGMVDTVELNYGVRPDYYIAIGVNGLRRLIDELGGVEITLTRAEAERLDHVPEIKGAGTYMLSSRGTMEYMRLRKIAGHEFSRTERQRKVIAQVLRQMENISLDQIINLTQLLFEEVKTDLDLMGLLDAMNAVYTLRGAELETMYLPQEGMYENVERHGMAVYELDWDANRKALDDFLHGRYTPETAEEPE